MAPELLGIFHSQWCPPTIQMICARPRYIEYLGYVEFVTQSMWKSTKWEIWDTDKAFRSRFVFPLCAHTNVGGLFEFFTM
jgi:hypothetical protein